MTLPILHHSHVKRTMGLPFLILGIALSQLGGCGYSSMTVTRGKPIDQSAISRIEIGKSTRADISRLLGTPHSMFEGQVDMEESQTIGPGAVLSAAGLSPLYMFYSYKDKRYLTSLDKNHYVMLYRFGKSAGKYVAANAVVVGYGNANITIETDELLLLLNKNTNVVEDVAYRREATEP